MSQEGTGKGREEGRGRKGKRKRGEEEEEKRGDLERKKEDKERERERKGREEREKRKQTNGKDIKVFEATGAITTTKNDEFILPNGTAMSATSSRSSTIDIRLGESESTDVKQIQFFKNPSAISTSKNDNSIIIDRHAVTSQRDRHRPFDFRHAPLKCFFRFYEIFSLVFFASFNSSSQFKGEGRLGEGKEKTNECQECGRH